MSLLAAHITKRSKKCPASYRHESDRIDFLKKALMQQSWAKTVLMEIDEESTYQSLYTKLANELQFDEESKVKEENYGTNDNEGNSKRTIFFTQPRYAKQTNGRLFTGASNDKSCWNCGKKGHHHKRCRFPLDPVRIAAAKAIFQQKNRNIADLACYQ